METKERYELLNRLFEEIKKEEKFPFAIDCVLQTGSNSGQFSFNITGRISFDERASCNNPIIPEIIEDGNMGAVKAEIRDAYKSIIESLLDRIAGIGCERIVTKQKPKELVLQGKEYKAYGTSQIPPKTILVSFNDDLWRNSNGQPKA